MDRIFGRKPASSCSAENFPPANRPFRAAPPAPSLRPVPAHILLTSGEDNPVIAILTLILYYRRQEVSNEPRWHCVYAPIKTCLGVLGFVEPLASVPSNGPETGHVSSCHLRSARRDSCMIVTEISYGRGGQRENISHRRGSAPKRRSGNGVGSFSGVFFDPHSSLFGKSGFFNNFPASYEHGMGLIVFGGKFPA